MTENGNDSNTRTSCGNGVRIDFIPAENSELGDERNTLIRTAYEALEEAGLSPVWSDISYCLSVKRRERTELFVLAEFSGEAFDHLRSLECSIMGPGIVLSCLRDGKPLPKSRYPVLSDCLSGVVACCSNVKQADRELIREKIISMNGKMEAYLSSECTVLITPEVGSRKYKAAAKQQTISIVTPAWVDEAWRRSQLEIFKASDEKSFFEKFRCPVFAGLTITVSNVKNEQRKAIERLVRENGGKFSGDMRQGETTHLVTDTTESQKFKCAKRWAQWSVFTVKTAWLHESVLRGYCMNEEDYPTAGPDNCDLSRRTNKCSTPRESVSGNAAFGDPNSTAMTSIVPETSNATVMSDVTLPTTSCVARSDLQTLQTIAENGHSPGGLEKTVTADTAKSKSPLNAQNNIVSPAPLKRMRPGHSEDPACSSAGSVENSGRPSGSKNTPSAVPLKRARTAGVISTPAPKVNRDVISQYMTDNTDTRSSFRPDFDLADAWDYVENGDFLEPTSKDRNDESPSAFMERKLRAAVAATDFGPAFYNSPGTVEDDLRRSLAKRLQNVLGRTSLKKRSGGGSTSRAASASTSSPAASGTEDKEEEEETTADGNGMPQSQNTQERVVVGWDDPNGNENGADDDNGPQSSSNGGIENKNRRQRERVFQLTSMNKAEFDRCVELIKKLGGTLTDLPTYDSRCTHLLATNPTRNEKLLTAMANGAWILHTSYLDASDKAGKFVEETEYEYGSSAMMPVVSKLREEVSKLMNCCPRWRQHIEASGDKAYTGWNVFLTADKAKEDGLMRIIINGGGEVTKSSQTAKEGVITHIITDPTKRLNASTLTVLKRLQAAGATWYKTDVIFAYLADEDLKDYVVKTQPKPSS